MRIRTAHMSEVRSERFSMVAPHICDRQRECKCKSNVRKKTEKYILVVRIIS
jgi:hypothetical protein